MNFYLHMLENIDSDVKRFTHYYFTTNLKTTLFTIDFSSQIFFKLVLKSCFQPWRAGPYYDDDAIEILSIVLHNVVS